MDIFSVVIENGGTSHSVLVPTSTEKFCQQTAAEFNRNRHDQFSAVVIPVLLSGATQRARRE